jgi:hypothetical protein
LSRTIGIIAEDLSDVKITQILARKISRKPLGFKHFVGRGCGKIQSKCKSWSRVLEERGCTGIIVLHDLDQRSEKGLRLALEQELASSRLQNKAVVIPVREIEAWLLSDEVAIKKAFKLPKAPRRISNPQSILRPKEYLRDMVYRCSNHQTTYVNSIHNEKIARLVSIRSLGLRCTSFEPFRTFFE